MDFFQHLKNQNRISDEDVIHFSREVLGDILVSKEEAEAVFALHHKIKDTCKAWNAFFVEVLVDYCVYQTKPEGYMSEENADWLVSQITKEGRVGSNSELELGIKVIERAKQVPTLFAAFALEQVAVAVIEGNGKLLNNEEIQPGKIGAAQASLIRRVLYGVGAEGQLAVSREEVEVLFELNDMTISQENHPEWTDVFIKAIACHLMAVNGVHAVGRKEAMRREEWLDDTQIDVAGMLAKTLSCVGEMMKADSLFNDFGSMQSKTETHRESIIDESESHWLVERIGRDGVFHDNEKALIQYLKKESPNLHSSLQPLLDKVA